MQISELKAANFLWYVGSVNKRIFKCQEASYSVPATANWTHCVQVLLLCKHVVEDADIKIEFNRICCCQK